MPTAVGSEPPGLSRTSRMMTAQPLGLANRSEHGPQFVVGPFGELRDPHVGHAAILVDAGIPVLITTTQTANGPGHDVPGCTDPPRRRRGGGPMSTPVPASPVSRSTHSSTGRFSAA